MKDLNFNAAIGTKTIRIDEKEIKFPSKILSILIIKENILVTFGGGSISEDILNSHDLLFNDCVEHNHNVWCFDFEGNLLWKIPSAYTEEQHRENITKEGLPLPVAYQGVYQDPDDENNIIAYNDYADYVFVRISDGTIVKKEKRGR